MAGPSPRSCPQLPLLSTDPGWHQGLSGSRSGQHASGRRPTPGGPAAPPASRRVIRGPEVSPTGRQRLLKGTPAPNRHCWEKPLQAQPGPPQDTGDLDRAGGRVSPPGLGAGNETRGRRRERRERGRRAGARRTHGCGKRDTTLPNPHGGESGCRGGPRAPGRLGSQTRCPQSPLDIGE